MSETTRSLAYFLHEQTGMRVEKLHEWVLQRKLRTLDDITALYRQATLSECLVRITNEIWAKHLEREDAA